MNSSLNTNKAHKGWLSRWTRKQWSRHWFVLKNGSLTYYRGPAAELCSFLDGVLDLSLIKQIEVQQPTANLTNSKPDHQDTNHHNYHLNSHHITGLTTGSANGAAASNGANQFTFTLKMWNGECHQLGAPTNQERQFWLKAINACINDESSSDASSDSSPTSNLSVKSLDIDNLGLNLSGAAQFKKQAGNKLQFYRADDFADERKSHISLDLTSSSVQLVESLRPSTESISFNGEQRRTGTSVSVREAMDGELVGRAEKEIVVTRHQEKACLVQAGEQKLVQKSSQSPLGSERNHSQAYKRRLICGDDHEQAAAAAADSLNSHLYTHIDHYHHLAMEAFRGGAPAQASDEDEEDQDGDEAEDEEDEDEEDDEDNEDENNRDEAKRRERAEAEKLSDEREISRLRAGDQTGAQIRLNISTDSICKQKKRVTFDLSPSSRGRPLSAPSDCSASSASDSDSSTPSSSSLSGLSSDEDDSPAEDSAPEVSLDRTAPSQQPEAGRLFPRREEIRSDEGGETEEMRNSSDLLSESELICAPKEGASSSSSREEAPKTSESEPSPDLLLFDCGQQPMDISTTSSSSGEQVEQKLLLREAQEKIESLEQKLSASFESYNQLEVNYIKLQSELMKCDELHKSELSKLQAKVDELNRELLKNELSLAEAQEKLKLRGPFEESENSGAANKSSTGRALSNWLRVTGQQQQMSIDGNCHQGLDGMGRKPSGKCLVGGPQQQQQQPPPRNNPGASNRPLLLSMHHFKHAIALNQQTLSLKLLNHSKQIQRKLNDLELKVDRIQGNSTATATTTDSKLPIINN